MEHKIIAVAAIGKNRELGKEDQLLWHIPDDLKRFKKLTDGHPIILGRKTFESIVTMIGKPLPGRTNIVVTGDLNYDKALKEKGIIGVYTTGSIEEAIWLAKRQPGAGEIYVGGGGRIYTEALPFLDRLCLTLIEDSKPADVFFPDYEPFFKKKVFIEPHEWNGLKYTWVDLER